MNNQTHRKSVHERFNKYTAKYRVADWAEIHVGKRPDSIGSDGDGMPWKEFIGLAACWFARDLENIKQSRVVKGVKCRKTDSIGFNEDGLSWKESIGLPAC